MRIQMTPTNAQFNENSIQDVNERKNPKKNKTGH